MFKFSIVAIIGMLTASPVYAGKLEQVLFAVDVSMSARQRASAIDVVHEMTNRAPPGMSIGLTLFDDTVRGFVAGSLLNETEQLSALKNALDNVPTSVRGTSNLAIGIERAIDDPVPSTGSHLIVFSRGVIDTPTQDSRARFSEWLESILLQQAEDKGVIVSLVLPFDHRADPRIIDGFSKFNSHNVISWRSPNLAPQELVQWLAIPDRSYGSEVGEMVDNGGESPASAATDTGSLQEPVNPPQTTNRLADKPLTTLRLVLLILASVLLIGIILWRMKSRREVTSVDSTAQTTSTYLPLSTKPGQTMNYRTEDDGHQSQSHSPRSNQTRPTPSESQRESVQSQPVVNESDSDDPWDKL